MGKFCEAFSNYQLSELTVDTILDVTLFFSLDDFEFPRTKVENLLNTKKTVLNNLHVERKRFALGADVSFL